MLKRLSAFCEWVDGWPWHGLLLSVVFLMAMFWVDSSSRRDVAGHRSPAIYSDRQSQHFDKANNPEIYAEPRKNGGTEFKLSDWLLVLFNGLLVVATVALFTSGERGVDAARGSARAAQNSADVARDSLLIGTRAYVYVTFQPAMVQSATTQHVESWNFTPVWRNSGPTPTRQLRNHISVKVFDNEIPKDWHFPDMWNWQVKEEDRKSLLLPLGPNSILNGQTVTLDIATVHDIVAGRKFAYIWGWARYRDVFPNTPTHITRFANRIVMGGDPTNPDKVSVSFPLIDRYNCSDDECAIAGYPEAWRATTETDAATS